MIFDFLIHNKTNIKYKLDWNMDYTLFKMDEFADPESSITFFKIDELKGLNYTDQKQILYYSYPEKDPNHKFSKCALLYSLFQILETGEQHQYSMHEFPIIEFS